jgi:hypothetical protein
MAEDFLSDGGGDDDDLLDGWNLADDEPSDDGPPSDVAGRIARPSEGRGPMGIGRGRVTADRSSGLDSSGVVHDFAVDSDRSDDFATSVEWCGRADSGAITCVYESEVLPETEGRTER